MRQAVSTKPIYFASGALALLLGCESTPSTNSTTNVAMNTESSGASSQPVSDAGFLQTPSESSDASAQSGPGAPVPPEPPCVGNSGPTRIPICRPPAAGDATAGYPAPYDRCMASFNGHPFSAQLTAADRRENASAGSCCYLDRCQISYGY